MHLDLIKSVAVSAAYKSAGVLRSYFGRAMKVTRKGARDLVTEADAESEQVIIDTIRQVFPDHAILAEESGRSTGPADHQWIIDPLDGTTNFTHQLGLFSISIAFALKGDIAVGVVLSPCSEELFTAVQGRGAELNGCPIRVSGRPTVSESLLVTGFPYDLTAEAGSLLDRLFRCMHASEGVRRLGSAALDLCYVACGRFDAFWEERLNPWDTAAGLLIAREAGARVTDFNDRPYVPGRTEILATNGRIHDEMLSLLKL